MENITPCDYSECPYDAFNSESCRVYCGLGVDENSYDEEEYIPSNTCGDYGSSTPWNAPGMSAIDFIR